VSSCHRVSLCVYVLPFSHTAPLSDVSAATCHSWTRSSTHPRATPTEASSGPPASVACPSFAQEVTHILFIVVLVCAHIICLCACAVVRVRVR
jgi:hypothetical protein